MRVAIYSRYSTDRQNESSIADQVSVCTEYAAREGMRVTLRFEDQGISGAALGNRPGALKLMEAALSRSFDVLLVTDLSRLSRSNGDLSKMIDRITAKGIRVVGVQDGYDSARRGHKLQAGLSGIIGEAFREMIRDRTHAALESRAKERRPTGGKCYGYRDGTVYEPEASVVREMIFTRYVDGASCRTIAAELNARGIPSPGSAWNRNVRRCGRWMQTGVYTIVRNERYTGLVRWNTSEWVKDPDTGKRLRRERPRSEWLEYRDPALQIIPDALFEQARQRTRDTSDDNAKLKAGGKPKHLLSGLLRCGVCRAHYILADKTHYACSGYLGGACSNGTRVRRDRAEQEILKPIREGLLAPERVERIGRQMQKLYAARLREMAKQTSAAPAELQALEQRLARLRERLAAGDPDMEPDEIQAAIDRAEGKRRELLGSKPAAKQSAAIIATLPKAAELYRKQIAAGLDKHPEAAMKARTILRRLVLEQVRLVPDEGGALWAEYELQPGALLLTGTNGSGGPQ